MSRVVRASLKGRNVSSVTSIVCTYRAGGVTKNELPIQSVNVLLYMYVFNSLPKPVRSHPKNQLPSYRKKPSRGLGGAAGFKK